MPSSKRNRIIPTSQTKKNRKQLARSLHANIQTAAETYAYIWVFSVQNMRNSFIKDVRTQLADSRIFMGKTKLMVHALGASAETECVPGVSGLKDFVTGEVGLLFTNRSPEEVEKLLGGFTCEDYARAGAVAGRAFVVPSGELKTRFGVEVGEEDPLPMSIEPTLRKLGIPTRVVKGKVVLEEGSGADDGERDGYVVCRENDVLDSRQTAILKIFGVRMAEFRIGLSAVFDKESGVVREIGSMDVDADALSE